VDGFELGLSNPHVVVDHPSADIVVVLCVVSLQIAHGLLVLGYVEVGVPAEIVVLRLLVSHPR
jgi:hypothetical protein